MQIVNQYCVIIVSSDTDTGAPLIESVMGPFTKTQAHKFCDQFNLEYDGSPWHSIVRTLTLVDLHADSVS